MTPPWSGHIDKRSWIVFMNTSTHATQEHHVHCGAREQTSILRCPSDQDHHQQIGHKCLLQTHPMDCYIPFQSHHQNRTVTGVLRCMWDRANRICVSPSKQQEFQHLQAVFQVNGFPADLVRKTLSHQTLPTLNLCTRAQQSHRGSYAYLTSVVSAKG